MDPALRTSVPELEFCAPADIVRKLRVSRDGARGAERARLAVHLAWYVRHRDWREARRLADEAEPLLAGLPAETADRLRARIALLRGDLACLAGEVDEAASGAAEALRQFIAI